MQRLLGIAIITLGITALLAAGVFVGSVSGDDPFGRLSIDAADSISHSVSATGSFFASVTGLLAQEDSPNGLPVNGNEDGTNSGTTGGDIENGNFFYPEDGFVPCGKRGGEGIAIEEPCNICHVGEMSQNIINFLIRTVVPLLAVVLIAWGGFEMLTAGGSEERYKAGRGRITQAVIGVAIVLVAWLLVNFFLSQIFSDQISGDWWSFQCEVEQAGPVQAVIPESPSVFPTGGVVPEPTGEFGAVLSGSEAESQLLAAGIEIFLVCSTGSLDGLHQAVIDEVVWLKESCNCKIVVTEGTGERCHSPNSNHYQGVKIDIDDTPGVTQFIHEFADAKFKRGGSHPATVFFFPGRSASYAQESNHWDIEVR